MDKQNKQDIYIYKRLSKKVLRMLVIYNKMSKLF